MNSGAEKARNQERRAFDRRVHAYVPYGGVALGIFMLTGPLFYFIWLPDQWSKLATIAAVAVAIVYFIVSWLVYTSRIGPEKSQLAASSMGLLLSADVYLYAYDTGNLLPIAYLMMLIVTSGAFFSSRLAFGIFSGGTIIGWLVYSAVVPGIDFVNGYAYGLLHALVLGILVLWLRSRMSSRVYQLIGVNRELNDSLMRSLSNTEASFRRLADNIPDIVFRVRPGPPWRVDYVSPAAEKVFGFSVDQILSRPGEVLARSVVNVEDLEKIRAGEFMQSGSAVLECRAADGRTIWLDMRSTTVEEEGEEDLIVEGTARDITLQKETELELVKQKERAETADRLKTNILANMSHEIRTPMTAILGYAEILQRELDGRPRRLASIINEGGRRLLHLLDSIIDLARIEADKIELQPTVHDARQTLRNVVEVLGLLAEKKGLELRTSLPAKAVMTATDPAREEQIITNIVGNAIRFTEVGHVAVGLKVVDEHGESRACFTVQDTGPGVSADFLPYVFEEFRQESEGIGRTHEGSGLGLSIVKRLVDKMSGTLGITSKEGVGTTVSVSFPAEVGSTEEAPVAEDKVSRDRTAPPSHGRLLVVEDDPDTASLIRDMTEMETVVCSSADAAIEAAKKECFSMALMDIHLRGSALNGVELLHRLRAIEAFAKTPAVALTAYAMKGDRERFLAEGFDAYLAKPFDMDALETLLAELPRQLPAD